MLHYVAHTVMQQEGSSLREDMKLIASASRISPHEIRKQLDLLGDETKLIGAELRQSTKYEFEAVESMKLLHAKAEFRLNDITAQFNVCEQDMLELLHYFGEDP